MNKSIKALSTSILLFAALGSAQASVVTFAPLTSPDLGYYSPGPYLENGLTFTSSREPDGLLHWGTSQSFNADPSGATLLQNWIGESINVTKTGGGDFFLNSFDLADGYNSGATGDPIPFAYVDGSGTTHTSTLALDNLVGLQTFTFNQTVKSFSLGQSYPYFQIDNVVFDAGDRVPEPTSVALLGIALAGLGATRRRKQT